MNDTDSPLPWELCYPGNPPRVISSHAMKEEAERNLPPRGSFFVRPRVEKPNATDATNDVVTEARAHIARLKADMRGVDTGCTNSYDTSLLGSLCAEIERLRAENHQAFMNGAAVVLRDLILAYDQPTMAKNIVKSLGLEPVDFQDCDRADYRAIRSASND